jgi:hypothetical protein
MLGQILAGASLGALVGLLVGLSSSPVVSTVVGALATALVTLLGFALPANAAKDVSQATTTLTHSAARIAAFGFTCVAALLSGLYIRTHALLSPSVQEQVAEIQNAHYTAEQARQWVAFKNLGAPETDVPANQRLPDAGKQLTSASILFAGGNEGNCQYFDTGRYKNTDEQLNALRLQGGTYADYANKIATLDPARQRTELDALKFLFCP